MKLQTATPRSTRYSQARPPFDPQTAPPHRPQHKASTQPRSNRLTRLLQQPPTAHLRYRDIAAALAEWESGEVGKWEGWKSRGMLTPSCAGDLRMGTGGAWMGAAPSRRGRGWDADVGRTAGMWRCPWGVRWARREQVRRAWRRLGRWRSARCQSGRLREWKRVEQASGHAARGAGVEGGRFGVGRDRIESGIASWSAERT
jgi:hypothetical protein